MSAHTDEPVEKSEIVTYNLFSIYEEFVQGALVISQRGDGLRVVSFHQNSRKTRRKVSHLVKHRLPVVEVVYWGEMS